MAEKEINIRESIVYEFDPYERRLKSKFVVRAPAGVRMINIIKAIDLKFGFRSIYSYWYADDISEKILERLGKEDSSCFKPIKIES